MYSKGHILNQFKDPMATNNKQWYLVTGGARRIGKAIALGLHADGANVAIHYNSSEQSAAELADELNAARPGSAITLQADLGSLDSLKQMTSKLLQHCGRLDGLVNNASSFYATPLAEVTEADWDNLMGSNLKGPLFLSQQVQKALTDTQGCIVNIIDIHARRPLREHVVYGCAKAGLAMLTRALAKDLAPTIRVNGVAPGAMLWPEPEPDEAVKQHILGEIPMGRQGEPADIAGCVVYLARHAPYVTGQIIAVDGGRSIGWS